MFELQPFRGINGEKKIPSSPSLFLNPPHITEKEKKDILQEQKVKDKQAEIAAWPDSSAQ